MYIPLELLFSSEEFIFSGDPMRFFISLKICLCLSIFCLLWYLGQNAAANRTWVGAWGGRYPQILIQTPPFHPYPCQLCQWRLSRYRSKKKPVLSMSLGFVNIVFKTLWDLYCQCHYMSLQSVCSILFLLSGEILPSINYW